MRADIDYAISEALTVYGKIGIKVWICRGEIYGKHDLSPNTGVTSNASGKSGFRGGDRRNAGDKAPRGEKRSDKPRFERKGERKGGDRKPRN